MSQGLWLRRRGASLAIAMICASFGFMPGLAGRASAVVLSSAGSTATLPGLDTYPPGSVEDGVELNKNFTSVNGLFTGTLDTWVYTDSVSGDLDFVYQLLNTTTGPADSLDRLSVSSFGGWSSDVDYAPIPTNPNGVGPTSGDRLGGVIGFNFTGDEIAPGEISDYLIVKTNATQVGEGTGSIIDGDSAQAEVQVPFGIAPMPEPASLGLLVIGAGMLSARRRRRI